MSCAVFEDKVHFLSHTVVYCALLKNSIILKALVLKTINNILCVTGLESPYCRILILLIGNIKINKSLFLPLYIHFIKWCMIYNPLSVRGVTHGRETIWI